MRWFVNGVEVDKIEPRLSFLDLEDDMKMLEKFMEWASMHYPKAKWEAILDRNVDGSEGKALVESLWIGGIPEWKRRGIRLGRIQVFARGCLWISGN